MALGKCAGVAFENCAVHERLHDSSAGAVRLGSHRRTDIGLALVARHSHCCILRPAVAPYKNFTVPRF